MKLKKMSMLALVLAATAAGAKHIVETDERLDSPDEGMLLGNGDLSVSVYEKADSLVFRFGKGDVWDRRLDTSLNPKPANIKEIIKGVLVEGWKCERYSGANTVAAKGTDNPKRMHEICTGTPPSVQNFPYPMPKPVGELTVWLPANLMQRSIRKRLLIEEGRCELECSWPNGLKLTFDTFVHPSDNVLALGWQMSGLDPKSPQVDPRKAPFWLTLCRWKDPDMLDYAARKDAETKGEAWYWFNRLWSEPGRPYEPLPIPECVQAAGGWAISQRFHPELTFPEGFRYLLAPIVSQKAQVIKPRMIDGHDAVLQIMPDGVTSGKLLFAIGTSSDKAGPEGEIKRLREKTGADLDAAFAKARAETIAGGCEFWSRSGVNFPKSPRLENAWYATLHARRCVLRGGTVPPGLYWPSAVGDFSNWHGDYHLNYNLQVAYYGILDINQLEVFRAYFDAISYFLEPGRKIAKDYYNGRGVFLQLMGYPIRYADDWIGTVPMGRMAYITGWATAPYWEYYRMTLDREWLAKTGYPVLRDAALFYQDFLKKGGSPDLPLDVKDDKYHLFPSNQAEEPFTGNPADLLDMPQVCCHCAQALLRAIRASEELGVDADLRAQWRDRYENLYGNDAVRLNELERIRYEANLAEFSEKNLKAFELYIYKGANDIFRRLREGHFAPEQDFYSYRDNSILNSQHPNGLIWGGDIYFFGRPCTGPEALRLMAPIQEMMFQSWEGALRIFPDWPKNEDASFRHFRAVGAFLVSAEWKDGKTGTIEVFSEQGSRCTLYPPWKAGIRVEEKGRGAVTVGKDMYGRLFFDTASDKTYLITPAAAE